MEIVPKPIKERDLSLSTEVNVIIRSERAKNPKSSLFRFLGKNYPIIRMSEAKEKKTRDGKYDDRPICKYGADCYRKNPAHFAEYRHPGIYK